MGRGLMLLVVILLALASGGGYLWLTAQITAGEKRIAEGQRAHAKGQGALAEGKAQLRAGKRELAEGKQAYAHAQDNLFVVLADKLLKGGQGFAGARKQIAEGDKRVAKGGGEVNAGEGRLETGALELRRGREQVRLAKGARVACALGAALFASLSLVLGFRWRRALARRGRRTAKSRWVSSWGT
jgi:hypothetical protein